MWPNPFLSKLMRNVYLINPKFTQIGIFGLKNAIWQPWLPAQRLSYKKVTQKFGILFVIFEIAAQIKQAHKRRKFAQYGHPEGGQSPYVGILPNPNLN
jgi:hypothetical protein